MRWLIFSDLQASDGGERCFNDPAKPLQRWRVDTFLERLKTIYQEYDCDGLIDLGDTTDDRQAIPIPTIHSVLSALDFFKGQNNIKLMGNHEQWLRSPEWHSGAMYGHLFKVVTTAELVTFPDCPVAFACVSYIEDETELKKAVQTVVRAAGKAPVVLLGHFSVAGAAVHGSKLDTGLTTTDLPKVAYGFLGHIHSHQEVKPNIFYVGSPFQQDFGEINEKKYVAIFDSDTMAIAWVDTRMPQYYRLTMEQFMVLAVKIGSEDRFEVKLRSFDEAKGFYSHPLADRAIPIYDFVEPGQPMANTTESVTFDTLSLLKAYIASNPPDKKGLSLSEEDLLRCGNDLMAS